jgi:hypothetical protein
MVGHIQGLALALYQDRPQREQELLVNRLIINGLLSFTTGSTNTSLTQTITSLQIRNQIPQWKQLLDACVKSERLNGAPTMPLQFKPPPKNVVNLYHSTNQPVEPDPLYEIVPVQPPLLLEQDSYQPSEKRYGYKKLTPVHEPRPTVGPRRNNHRQLHNNQAPPQNNNNNNNAQYYADNNDRDNQADIQIDPEMQVETAQEHVETPEVNIRPQTRNRIKDALRVTTTQDGTPIIDMTANRPQSSATAYNDYDNRVVGASTRSRTKETLQKIINSPKNQKSRNNSMDEQNNYQVDLMLTQYDRRPSKENRGRNSRNRERERSSSRERSESRERYNYNKYPSKQISKGVPKSTYRNNSSRRSRRSWSKSPSRYYKYRSYSRDRYNRSSSRNSYRNKRYNLSDTRETYNKRNKERNSRSISNNRNKQNYNTKNKQNNYSRSTSRSNIKNKFCKKCFIKNAHEEEECPIYRNKATEKCRKCNNGYHYTKECRSKTRSPSANRSKSPRKN